MTRRHLKKSKAHKKHFKEFPSISRTIPEPEITVAQELKAVERWYHRWQRKLAIFRHKLVVNAVMGISLGLFVVVAVVGYQTYQMEGKRNQLVAKREKLLADRHYWENIAQKYKGYRDAYYQLAVISYRLGEKSKTTTYLQKVFALDPNFKPARELEELLQ